MRSYQLKPADTLVEVLLATVILSAVLAGAFALSNRALRIGQASLERTEAVNIVRENAEIISFIHSADGDEYDQLWQRIVDNTTTNAPSYADDNYCNVTSTKPLYIDQAAISTIGTGGFNAGNIVSRFGGIPQDLQGRLLYNDAADNNPDDFFAIWLEAYRPAGAEYIDIHIRACWESVSGTQVDRAGTVIRLSEVRNTT